jgi:hypothetical protein
MPTTRPRHVITETAEVAEALDVAARRWPEDAGSRTRLVVHLVREGARALHEDADCALERRLAVLLHEHGALAGVYGPDYLERLREDWPA